MKYYILREDGSSLFSLPYPADFCYHCLGLLIEDGQRYRLLAFANTPIQCLPLILTSAKLTAKNVRDPRKSTRYSKDVRYHTRCACSFRALPAP